MEKKVLWITTCLLLITNVISFCIAEKHFEAACLLGDYAHLSMDKNPENEELFYEMFQDLDIGSYETPFINNVDELDNYSWAY